ncbi:zinc finger protein 141-like [Ornithodoros turicata]|uniref:zinc finger protein 141-like n=1 Tax=Ornithodoros turicata TaxID=34597 RepID=UPI00313A2F19
MKVKRKPSPSFSCGGCKRSIKTAHNFELHRRSCKKAKRKELEDMLLDQARTILKDHATHRRVDSEVSSCRKGYVCEFCDKTFELFSNLNQHRRLHSWQRPYSCQHCGIRFSKEKALQEHVEIHDTCDIPRTCVICGEHIVSVRGFVWHLKAVHKNLMHNLELEGWDHDILAPSV